MTSKTANVITNQPLGQGAVTSHTELDFTPATFRHDFEPFIEIEQLIVKQKQKRDYSIDNPNKYEILSTTGEDLFNASMSHQIRSRRHKNFTLTIGDILTVHGDVSRMCCFTKSIAIVSNRGLPIGSVVQINVKEFMLEDNSGPTGITILEISCSSDCCGCMDLCSSGEVSDLCIYAVNESSNKVQVRGIDKRWTGKDVWDKFYIKFFSNMDPTHKALILCSAFLIDFQ